MREQSRSADWISLDDAIARLLGFVEPLPSEDVALDDALGRTLSEAAVSPLDLPPWDNTAMDGYAVHSADVTGASAQNPVRLDLIESVHAGGFPTRPVARGQTIKIMTGAPIPEGADGVIRIEHTRAEGDVVFVLADTDASRNIRPRGEDIKANDVAVTAGTQLRASEIGLLASIGAATVRVHRRPVVAILSTGDELTDLAGFDEVLAGRRIVNSNSHAIAAAVRSIGAEPRILGIAKDDADSLREHLRRGLDADVLVTTAGASVGEHDLVKDVLEELGADTHFWRVRIRPGSPFSFSVAAGVPVFGLPGNPVSAVVTFEILVKPALRRMLGRRAVFSPVVSAVLAERISAKSGLTQFMRVTLIERDGTLIARLTGPQGSGIISSIAQADGLMVMPEDVDELAAGSEVRVVRLQASDDAQPELGFRTRMTQ